MCKLKREYPIGYAEFNVTDGKILQKTAENIGMCLALLPVVGITLPFMSYGAS